MPPTSETLPVSRIGFAMSERTDVAVEVPSIVMIISAQTVTEPFEDVLRCSCVPSKMTSIE